MEMFVFDSVIHWLRYYGFIIVGCFLVLINFSLFSLIISERALRKNYLILTMIFLHNGLTGFVSIIYRLKLFHFYTKTDAVHSSNKHCLYDIVIVLIFLNTLDGVGLMVGGIERLIAAAFPLYYYRKKNSILRKLILLEYIISLSPLITAINITFQQPDRHVHDICLKHEIFQRGVYVIILLTRSLSAAASLIIMAAVVIIMKRYTQKLTERRNVQRNMEIFIEKQKQYTSTSVISCIITFFLFVLPSTVEAITSLTEFHSFSTISDFAIFLCYLNAFNLCFVFILCQADVRTAVFDTFKKICKRNNTEMNMIKGTSVHLYCVRRQAQLRVPAKGLNRNITTE